MSVKWSLAGAEVFLRYWNQMWEFSKVSATICISDKQSVERHENWVCLKKTDLAKHMIQFAPKWGPIGWKKCWNWAFTSALKPELIRDKNKTSPLLIKHWKKVYILASFSSVGPFVQTQPHTWLRKGNRHPNPPCPINNNPLCMALM